MTERSEDWNVGLAQDLQDDDFVREFVAAAIEEGVPVKAVLLKLSAANRADLAVALGIVWATRNGTRPVNSATNNGLSSIGAGRSIWRVRNEHCLAKRPQ